MMSFDEILERGRGVSKRKIFERSTSQQQNTAVYVGHAEY